MPNLTCIEQKIATGGQFDGTLPTTTSTDTAGVRVFPEDATGGLFTFFDALPALPPATDRYLNVRRIALDMTNLNAADVWYLRLASAGGDVIFYSDGPGDYVWTPDGPDGLIISPDETLKLYNGIVSTGALFARVWAEPFLPHFRAGRS